MANPDAESMIMRMSAQVSLEPAQTSHASNLKKLREIAAGKKCERSKQAKTDTALLPGTPSHPAHDEESPPQTPQLSTTDLPFGTPVSDVIQSTRNAR